MFSYELKTTAIMMFKFCLIAFFGISLAVITLLFIAGRGCRVKSVDKQKGNRELFSSANAVFTLGRNMFSLITNQKHVSL